MDTPNKPGHYWVRYTDGSMSPVTFEDAWNLDGSIETGNLYFDEDNPSGKYFSPKEFEKWFRFDSWVGVCEPPHDDNE